MKVIILKYKDLKNLIIDNIKNIKNIKYKFNKIKK